MKDLMVDIETLGTSPTALITQIGACYFDRLTGQIGDKLCHNVSIQDGLDLGFSVDGSTIEFWLRQPGRTFLEGPLYSVGDALANFSSFAKGCTSAWAHATFDFPILANAYNVLRMKLPFSYRLTRDIRTLVDLSGVKVPKAASEETHNALDDCIYQVEYCVKYFKELRRRA